MPWMRVMRRTVRQVYGDFGDGLVYGYEIDLELSRLVSPCTAAIVQHGEGTTDGYVVFDATPTPGNVLFVALVKEVGSPPGDFEIDGFTLAGRAETPTDSATVQLFYRVAGAGESNSYQVVVGLGGPLVAFWAEFALGGSAAATPDDVETVSLTYPDGSPHIDATPTGGTNGLTFGAAYFANASTPIADPGELLDVEYFAVGNGRPTMDGWTDGGGELGFTYSGFAFSSGAAMVALTWSQTCG